MPHSHFVVHGSFGDRRNCSIPCSCMTINWSSLELTNDKADDQNHKYERCNAYI